MSKTRNKQLWKNEDGSSIYKSGHLSSSIKSQLNKKFNAPGEVTLPDNFDGRVITNDVKYFDDKFTHVFEEADNVNTVLGIKINRSIVDGNNKFFITNESASVLNTRDKNKLENNKLFSEPNDFYRLWRDFDTTRNLEKHNLDDILEQNYEEKSYTPFIEDYSLFYYEGESVSPFETNHDIDVKKRKQIKFSVKFDEDQFFCHSLIAHNDIDTSENPSDNIDYTDYFNIIDVTNQKAFTTSSFSFTNAYVNFNDRRLEYNNLQERLVSDYEDNIFPKNPESPMSDGHFLGSFTDPYGFAISRYLTFKNLAFTPYFKPQNVTLSDGSTLSRDLIEPRPTTSSGFPQNNHWRPSSNHLVDMSSYLTNNFMLEKVIINTKVSSTNGNNTLKHAYGNKYDDSQTLITKHPLKNYNQSNNSDNLINNKSCLTFYILNNRKNNSSIHSLNPLNNFEFFYESLQDLSSSPYFNEKTIIKNFNQSHSFLNNNSFKDRSYTYYINNLNEMFFQKTLNNTFTYLERDGTFSQNKIASGGNKFVVFNWATYTDIVKSTDVYSNHLGSISTYNSANEDQINEESFSLAYELSSYSNTGNISNINEMNAPHDSRDLITYSNFIFDADSEIKDVNIKDVVKKSNVSSGYDASEYILLSNTEYVNQKLDFTEWPLLDNTSGLVVLLNNIDNLADAKTELARSQFVLKGDVSAIKNRDIAENYTYYVPIKFTSQSGREDLYTADEATFNVTGSGANTTTKDAKVVLVGTDLFEEAFRYTWDNRDLDKIKVTLNELIENALIFFSNNSQVTLYRSATDDGRIDEDFENIFSPFIFRQSNSVSYFKATSSLGNQFVEDTLSFYNIRFAQTNMGVFWTTEEINRYSWQFGEVESFQNNNHLFILEGTNKGGTSLISLEEDREFDKSLITESQRNKTYFSSDEFNSPEEYAYKYLIKPEDKLTFGINLNTNGDLFSSLAKIHEGIDITLIGYEIEPSSLNESKYTKSIKKTFIGDNTRKYANDAISYMRGNIYTNIFNNDKLLKNSKKSKIDSLTSKKYREFNNMISLSEADTISDGTSTITKSKSYIKDSVLPNIHDLFASQVSNDSILLTLEDKEEGVNHVNIKSFLPYSQNFEDVSSYNTIREDFGSLEDSIVSLKIEKESIQNANKDYLSDEINIKNYCLPYMNFDTDQEADRTFDRTYLKTIEGTSPNFSFVKNDVLISKPFYNAIYNSLTSEDRFRTSFTIQKPIGFENPILVMMYDEDSENFYTKMYDYIKAIFNEFPNNNDVLKFTTQKNSNVFLNKKFNYRFRVEGVEGDLVFSVYLGRSEDLNNIDEYISNLTLENLLNPSIKDEKRPIVYMDLNYYHFKNTNDSPNPIFYFDLHNNFTIPTNRGNNFFIDEDVLNTPNLTEPNSYVHYLISQLDARYNIIFGNYTNITDFLFTQQNRIFKSYKTSINLPSSIGKYISSSQKSSVFKSESFPNDFVLQQYLYNSTHLGYNQKLSEYPKIIENNKHKYIDSIYLGDNIEDYKNVIKDTNKITNFSSDIEIREKIYVSEIFYSKGLNFDNEVSLGAKLVWKYKRLNGTNDYYIDIIDLFSFISDSENKVISNEDKSIVIPTTGYIKIYDDSLYKLDKTHSLMGTFMTGFLSFTTVDLKTDNIPYFIIQLDNLNRASDENGHSKIYTLNSDSDTWLENKHKYNAINSLLYCENKKGSYAIDSKAMFKFGVYNSSPVTPSVVFNANNFGHYADLYKSGINTATIVKNKETENRARIIYPVTKRFVDEYYVFYESIDGVALKSYNTDTYCRVNEYFDDSTVN